MFSVDRQKMCVVYTPPIFQQVMGLDSVVVVLRKHKKMRVAKF